MRRYGNKPARPGIRYQRGKGAIAPRRRVRYIRWGEAYPGEREDIVRRQNGEEAEECKQKNPTNHLRWR